MNKDYWWHEEQKSQESQQGQDRAVKDWREIKDRCPTYWNVSPPFDLCRRVNTLRVKSQMLEAYTSMYDGLLSFPPSKDVDVLVQKLDELQIWIERAIK